MGTQLDPSTKSSIEATISNLKQAINGEDIDEIKRLTDTLTQASHQMATAAYQQSAGTGAQHDSAAFGDNPAADNRPEDDVVDAEYQEVA